MEKLASTIDMNHEEWLRARKNGIGGSDAGAVCGLNPYSSPMKVYFDKISDDVIDIDNESMRQGRDLEQYVAERFMEATGKKVRKSNVIYGNKEYPFMFANVDRLVVGEGVGLECKTASAYSADKWNDGNIPPHYLIQCFHYMAVTGAKAWYIAVVILGKEFKYAKIERDEELIQNLIKIEKDFWENHVMKRVMPNPDGTEVSEELIKQYFSKADFNKAVSLHGFDDKLKRREELECIIKRLDKEKKQIEQEVKIYMEDAEIAVSDEYTVSWKNIITQKLDSKRLKEELPEIYTKYEMPIYSRRFTIKSA